MSNLLAQYDECRQSIINCRSSQEYNITHISELQGKLSQTQLSKRSLLSEMQYNLDKLTLDQLNKMITTKRDELLSQKEIVVQKINSYNDKANKMGEVINSKIDATKYPHDLVTIRNAEKVLKEGKEVITTMASKSILATVENALSLDLNNYNIEALTVKVKNTLDAVPDTLDTSIFAKVINGMLLNINDLKTIAPVTRLLIYAFYLVVIGISLVSIPLLVILPYSLMLGFSLVTNVKRSRKLVDFIYPYKLLEERIVNVRGQLNSKINNARSKEHKRLSESLEEKTKPLKDKIVELNKQISNVEVKVRTEVGTEDLIASAKAEYEARIKACEESAEETQAQIAKTYKFIESDKLQLQNSIGKKAELQKLVAENYLNPKEPGDSQLLCKTFFLGFDDEEELIEFRYEGKTTTVMYKGQDNGVNAPFITMMVMQLLAAMSIISLRIAITDTRTGCTDYAVFSPEILSTRIKLCATNQDVTKIIEEYHEEFLMRNKTVLTTAKTLEDYNLQMISRKSLTREYYILFLQDPDVALLGSQKFMQLCMSGPRVGIIPIVFISHAFVNEMIHGKPQDAEGFKKFLETCGDKFFVYDGNSQDLSEEPKTRDSILDRIRPK